MPWKNQAQVEEELKQISDKTRLQKFYNLREIINQSIFPQDYEANPAYARYLVKSEHAQEILDSNSEIEDEFSASDVVLGLMDFFYFNDLLIDINTSDIDEVIRLFSEEIRSNKVKLPHRFGRELYDKFNDNFNNDRTEFLEYDDVVKLLDSTEQGIYQVGNLVTGPFGIIESLEVRYLPPSLKLPLWHCSDTGCTALHSVQLNVTASMNIQAYNSIAEAGKELFGHDSEWEGPYSYLHRGEKWAGGRPYTDLCVLISDTILGIERSNLLKQAISSDQGAFLRNILRTYGKKKAAEGSVDDVVKKLSSAEQLQLLFLLTDDSLIKLIDDCVQRRIIKIPANELRVVRTGATSLYSLDRFCELSMYGVKSDSRDPLVSFSAAIWEGYNKAGLLDDLAWRCSKHEGSATPGMVMAYLRDHSPQEAVQTLILPSRVVLNYLSEKFIMHLIASESDTDLTNRLLWKVGFDVTRYEADYISFINRLQSFNDTLLSINEIKSEADREAIRSAGVNLFVSLEHILEEFISYNVWMLSSDHFLNTHFNFNNKDAVKSVSDIIGSSKDSGSFTAHWDDKGGNTLGTLLVYLSATSNWIESLITKSKEDIKRAPEDLPHYTSDDERIFAFAHTELWADATQSELKRLYEHFDKAVKLFLTSALAEIRNGLDHKRTDLTFPDMNAMLACCARLKDAFNIIDAFRFLPKTYWLNSKQVDVYGRIQSEAFDYQKKAIRLFGPSEMSGLPSIKFGKPALVPFGNLLGIPNSEIVFGIQEVSPYSEYWNGYPRRRFIPAKEAEGVTEEVEVVESIDNEE
ncbi:hypothetical protein H8B13_18940 [Hymenobacter sp. BT188]|uniref:hypothetical protein n=1 Tax=Hymenobacter sp. BT188 TaxID=2763504 RepID=UPI001651A88F|nr:hypothetical protein [Hymenobacter sp. BT188]MBC6608905.1 hypothetical protein [Hymenobacter sp. BT188]